MNSTVNAPDDLSRAVELVDLPQLIQDFYPDAGPPRRKRFKATWRGGDGYSVSVRRSKGRWWWHDYKTGEGGSAYDFLVIIAGLTPGEAANELKARAGLGADRRSPDAQRKAREAADRRRREAADREAREAADREAGVELDLATWERLDTRGSSPYLDRKLPGVAVEGVRYGSDYRGSFVALQVSSVDGPRGLQRIYADGAKRFTAGMKKRGGYVVVEPVERGVRVSGALPRGKQLYVVEGFATGVSVALAAQAPVIVAFDAGNLDPVVSAVRRELGPRSKLWVTIAADNDKWKARELDRGQPKGNPGLEAANLVAFTRQARVATPDFSGLDGRAQPTDFNDLHALGGLDAVAAQLVAAAPDLTAAFAADIRKQQRHLDRSGATRQPHVTLDLQPGVNVMRSPQGTGKTSGLVSALDKLQQREDVRVAYLSHRESLTLDAAARLGLETYNAYNAHELRLISQAAICLNSVHKLRREDGTVEAYDVLVIDEIEQFVRAIKGGHIRNKTANLDALKTLVQRAKYLVCLDADAGPLTMKLLKMWRPGERYHWVVNHHDVGRGKKVYLHDHPGGVYKAALDKGRPFFITNSKRASADFHELATDRGLQGALVNGETSGEHGALFTDVNHAVQGLDFLSASPSVSTGLSLTTAHFNVTAGVFTRNVGAPEDVVQALWRDRTQTEFHLYLDPRTSHDELDVEARYGATLDKERELLGGSLPGENDPEYERIRSAVERRERVGRAAYRANVVRLLIQQGFEVELVEGDSEALDEHKALFDRARELGNERYLLDRLDAAILDDDEAAKLRGAQQQTAADRYALDRYDLTQFYVVDPADRAAVEAWLGLDNRKHYRRALTNLERAIAPLDRIRTDIDELGEAHDKRADIPLMATRREVHRRVLGAVGFNEAVAGDEVRYARDGDRIAALVAWVEANRRWISGLLSLPSPAKLAANAVRYVGTWLRELGLRQERVGRNDKGEYRLEPSSVATAVEVMKRRGTFSVEAPISKENVPAPPRRYSPHVDALIAGVRAGEICPAGLDKLQAHITRLESGDESAYAPLDCYAKELIHGGHLAV